MLLSRIILLIISLTIISCGFKPLHKEETDNKVIIGLAAIKINHIGDRNTKKLSYSLEDILNPNNIVIKQKYTLQIRTDRKVVASAILKDSQATRTKITITANYILKDTTSNKIINQGHISNSNSFDISRSNEFTNYTSESYVTDIIIREISSELKTRLSNIFIRLEK